MKLLIGYDGSAGADLAIDDLGRAGLPADVEAEVLCAADVLMPLADADDTDLPPLVAVAVAEARDAMADALAIAQRGAERLAERFPTWTIMPTVASDSPAWAVLKRADEWPADLISVGARGMGGLQRLLLGSVSGTIVTEATGDVRVAREGAVPEARDDAATRPVRIVVGVDGSPFADRAIDAVAARSWPPGSSARVVAVVDAKLAGALTAGIEAALRWADIVGADDAEAATDGTAWIRAMADASADRLRESGLDAEAVVLHGDPKAVLVADAGAFNAHVVFVGARGLSRVERVLLGGLSRAVVARAPCTVEVVR